MRVAVQGPLMGKRIVVTRQVERAQSLSDRLEAQGAQTFFVLRSRLFPRLPMERWTRRFPGLKVTDGLSFLAPIVCEVSSGEC